MEIPAGTYSPEVRTSCKSQHHPEPRCQRAHAWRFRRLRARVSLMNPMVTWRAWGIPVRCGAGMVVLQTLLALYRFGDSTALLQLVNPLMWIGLGLFFVTGWLIGWVVERLLRGTTGRFRTLLLGATILATPVAVAGSLVGGLFRPSGGPALWPDPVSPPGGDSQTDWGRVDRAWLLSFRKQSTNNSRRCRTSHQVDRPPDSERTWAGRPPFDVAACQDGHLPLAAGALLAREEALAHHRVPT